MWFDWLATPPETLQLAYPFGCRPADHRANSTRSTRFGTVATLLEMIPVASIVFTFTNTGKSRQIWLLSTRGKAGG
jgi:hypothetical protein